ncbi:MAG: hypothetical protein A4E51_01436 [Methanosaeta sp. PtaU1.Bin055]|nr:MAG: hypothetical protein A4E51_01436 [Methanosaeta sp. PtaU1.Bin055]
MISISSTVPTGPEGIMKPSKRRRPRGGFAKVTSVSTGVEEMAISWAISRSFPGFFASETSNLEEDLTIEDRRATISPTPICASSAGRVKREGERGEQALGPGPDPVAAAVEEEPDPDPRAEARAATPSSSPAPWTGRRGPAETRG